MIVIPVLLTSCSNMENDANMVKKLDEIKVEEKLESFRKKAKIIYFLVLVQLQGQDQTVQ